MIMTVMMIGRKCNTPTFYIIPTYIKFYYIVTLAELELLVVKTPVTYREILKTGSHIQ